MSEWRRKAGVVKRRLINAKHELLPPKSGGAKPFDRSAGPRALAVDAASATNLIHGRLSDQQVAEIAQRAEASEELVDYPVPPGAPPQKLRFVQPWIDAQGIDRKRWDLVLGVHFELEDVLAATGLSTAAPPDEIHAMAHGPFAAGGGFYQADMIADSLASAGAPIGAGQRVLDFGCSSGRVARVLAAAFPDAEILGCDPNGPAIEWASANLPMASFVKSENDPPLPYDDASVDAAFGVSIWSHYAEHLALRWYDEMWRILKPGGHLISTTHGVESIAFYGNLGLRSNHQLGEIKQSLYDGGYWYAPEFGEAGDWGVVNNDWGTSFVSADWMLDNLTPKWQIVEYATARNENNQDVYVLRKTA